MRHTKKCLAGGVCNCAIEFSNTTEDKPMIDIDIDEFNQRTAMIIGASLIGYNRMADSKRYDQYRPPSQEDIIEAFQNQPFFAQIVKTLTAHILHIVKELNEPT